MSEGAFVRQPAVQQSEQRKPDCQLFSLRLQEVAAQNPGTINQANEKGG